MPLYSTNTHHNNTAIYCWKVTESTTNLSKGISLSEYSKNRISAMKSDTHISCFLAVRQLLSIAGFSDSDLLYTNTGKPYLKNSALHVSISHSFEFAVLAISATEIGVDIEKVRAKIVRLSSKFIETEASYLQQTNLEEQLTVIWGAKECLFKIHPTGGLSFINDIYIEKFKLQDKKTIGLLKKEPHQNSYAVYFTSVEEYMLVYATNEPKTLI